MAKTNQEIMEILEAFDLTRSVWSAAQLAGCDPKTVEHYVERRAAGYDPYRRARRPRLVDLYAEKIEELVDHSHAKVRADVVYDRLVAMGFSGDERTVRRAVAEGKAQYRNGHRRTYRPWIPEPGMWLQHDWGWGPVIDLRQTYLFCAWLAWSRYRVIIPTWDRTLGTVLTCMDNTLRRLGGAPTYWLTDNERTLTTDRVAGVPVRHPDLVAAGRHYGLKVETCVPYDPETKGGSEATVRVAKADLVPTEANLLPAYGNFKELVVACEAQMVTVNERAHRETRRPPVEMLAEEHQHLHALPLEPYAAALGDTRQCVRTRPSGSVTCPTRRRRGTLARRCGFVSKARRWWWSGGTGAASWSRSSAMSCPLRGGRAFWTSTIPTTPMAAASSSPSCGRARPPSRPSWTSAPAPSAGCAPPPPPASAASATK